MHLDQSVDIVIPEVCQRDIIPVKEGQARVVILEVYALTHSLRILVNEAEDALVLTAVLFIHKRRAEGEPDIVILRLADRSLKALTAALKRQGHVRYREVEAIVEHVAYLMTVH